MKDLESVRISCEDHNKFLQCKISDLTLTNLIKQNTKGDRPVYMASILAKEDNLNDQLKTKSDTEGDEKVDPMLVLISETNDIPNIPLLNFVLRGDVEMVKKFRFEIKNSNGQ